VLRKTDPMLKRDVEIVVISDVHLGTYGCHAKELLNYLKSVNPGILILNGDFIDVWQFRKRYWPEAHMKIIKKITGFIAKGIPVYYLTGNHDDMLRKFSDFEMGSFKLLDKLILEINGEKAWIFHGDVFDVSMKHSKWLAKLGGKGYDILILINRLVNFFSIKMGKGKISLSKKIKDGVKSAVKFINDFEVTAAEIAVEKNYKYVVCGHIHKPEIKTIKTEKGNVTYMNSGDWIENLTSLEYNEGKWSLYEYNKDTLAPKFELQKIKNKHRHSEKEVLLNILLGEESSPIYK
jgi:UDP-2,3-diacylglucosamine pyrophosphatase LpxH